MYAKATPGDPARLNRSFWVVCSAAGVSGFGDGLRVTVVPLIAAAMTGAPGAVGVVTAAGMAPWVVFGLFGGLVGDRFERYRVMWRADAVRAVVVAGLAGWLSIRHPGLVVVVLVVFALGVAQCVFDPAAVALLPDLVPRAGLPRANAVLAMTQTTTSDLAGPVAAGLLYGVAQAVPLWVDATTFVLSAALLTRLPHPSPCSTRAATPAPAPTAGDTGRACEVPVRYQLHQGWDHIRATPLLASLLGVTALLSTSSGALLAVLVLHVHQALHAGSTTYGILLALFAAGALLGSAIAGRTRHARASRMSVTVITLGAGITLLTLAVSHTTLTAGPALIGFGTAAGGWTVIVATARARLTPAPLLARVAAIWLTTSRAASTLGALAAGLAATYLGIPATLTLTGALLTTAVATATPLTRRIRHTPTTTP